MFHALVARGVRDAAVVNRIVTVFKIIPILVFIVVLLVNFDAGVFSDNWTAYGYGDLGSLDEQIRNTMLITTFVFIGIEGASVYSRYARRREDVGRATVMGFLSVLSIFSLVTLSSYSVVPQPELAATRQPSMVGVFESVVGDWGEVFISVAVIVSVLGAYLAWTLMAAEVMFIPARQDDFPEFLGRENASGTPITALVVTSLAVQGLLALTLFVDDALNFMLDLSTSLALLPYLLAAAYALKLGLTGESYEGVTATVRRKETIVAGAATAYTLFLFDAAGHEVRPADDGAPRAGVAALRQGPQRARPAAVQPGRDRRSSPSSWPAAPSASSGSGPVASPCDPLHPDERAAHDRRRRPRRTACTPRWAGCAR